MNRTTILLSSAVVLLIAAILVGLPRATGSAPQPPAPAPGPVAVPSPAATPILPQDPAPARAGSLALTGGLSHPFISSGTSDLFATLEVKAVDVPGARRAPVNLAVVIDRSGSMTGAKIENARRAALKLVDLLEDGDHLAVVDYGTDVRGLSGVFVTPDARLRLRRYISAIVAEGGTNTGEALKEGKAQLDVVRGDFHVNRLILLSDGQPTVGVTSVQGLSAIVGALREGGVTVTSLGIGADFNEDLMQHLADVGGGSYGFINSSTETATLFERDLKQAGTMVARDVGLTVTLPDGVEFVEVYGRPSSQSGRAVSLALPDFSATQTEKLVLHLRTHTSAVSGTLDIGGFRLDYQDLLARAPANARLSLASALTNDPSVVFARRDKSALVIATKAQAAMNYQSAAHAIDRGDYAGANQAIERNAGLFDDAEATAGKDSLADERAASQSMFGLSTKAASAPVERQKETVKEMKKQMFKSAGRGASLY
jgi:Ca-activated chloride channel family protein